MQRRNQFRPLRAEVLESRLNQATLTVTALTDVVNSADDASVFTLREAVNAANAVTGADTIQFAGGLNGTITLGGTELALTDTAGATTIVGPGANVLAVSGNNAARVFRIAAGVTANIGGLTIRNGASGQGGGILNAGTLYLTGSEVRNNATTGDGGGLWSSGVLTITDCTFAGNSSAVSAGAIGVYAGGTANIVNTTISGNTAQLYGGGMDVNNAVVDVFNSTITLNRAQSANGGDGNGGGISNWGAVILRNSIVAGNTRLTSAVNDDLANNALNAASSCNLIGDASSRGGLTHNQNGNQIGNAGSGTIALGTVLNTSLTNNGGSTRTHALATGSPALNAGLNANVPGGLATDQRGIGFARIVGTVDIGAVETPAAPLLPDAFESNDTADAAANLGVVSNRVLTDLTLVDTPFGLPDYDWFQFTAAATGSLTIRLDTNPARAELYVYRLSGQTLIPLGSSTAAANLQSVTIAASAGSVYFIQARGHQVSPGVLTSTGYSLTLATASSNQAPTNVSLDNLRVRENTPGAIVGAVTVTDPNPSDTHTFVVSDSRFHVVAGQLQLKPTESLHFATEPVVNLTITATDNGGLSSPAVPFTIAVRQGSEAAPYHNSFEPANVDRVDGIDPADILWATYYYGLYPNGILPPPPEDDQYPLVDVTGDGLIDPQDILYAIVDYAAAQSGEGEAAITAAAQAVPPDAALHEAALAWLLGSEWETKRKARAND